VFARQGRLLGTRLDLSALRPESEPEVVVDGVRYDPQNGGTHLAVSEDGTLVYAPGTPTSPERGLAFVDGTGEAQRILDPPRVVRDPRLSPDGRKVALVLTQKQASDLWLLDVASGTLSQLTFGLSPRRPTWTPDGKSITVGAPVQGGGWRLLSVPARSGASPAPLLETAGRAYPNDWSPDGRTLVFQERGESSGWDLFTASLSSANRLEDRRALAATPADEENAGLSPDGRLLAYESNELDGVFEIYVRALREGGAAVRASTEGGRWPRFAPGGRLFFWQSGTGGLRRLDYQQSADRFRPAPVVVVWGHRPGGETAVSRRYMVGGSDAPYDVDPAGKFLMLQRIPAGPEPLFRKPVVVLGFGPGLKRPGSGS
jgi:Tol biopolymer transport system component